MGYVLLATKNITTKGGTWWRATLLACLWAGLLFGLTGWRASQFAAASLNPALEGRDVAVTGVVASLPQPFDLGQRFRFAPDSSALEGQPVALPGLLELAWYAPAAERPEGFDAQGAPALAPLAAPRAGERWQFTVRLKAVHGSVNPHGFDFELSQWEQGVQASGYVRAARHDPRPQRLSPAGWQHPVTQLRQHLRERIYQQVADPSAAGLIAALVVGDQAAIGRSDWDVFRATGVAHLMSISGLHITMFAWLAGLLVGGLWRRSPALCLRWPAASAALVGGVLLALAYALFSGMGIPAQRTLLMLACVALLRHSGVRWPWPQVWLLTCAVVVAFDPWALLQAGFWLSFVAVGILFASDSRATSAVGVRATGRFSSMFREQWVITLALAPLSLVLFGQVSLVGLVANALAIPLVTLLITPLVMLGTLISGLWQLAAELLLLLMALLRWLAALPWAVWQVAQAPGWAAAAGVLGGVLLVLRLPWSLRLGGVPLLLPVLLWQPALPALGQFELLAADIGQGSAVLVRTAQHALLFDAGPRYSQDSDAGQRVLVPLLRALGVWLNTLVLSHRDSDHIGGAAAVLATQSQARVISSFDPVDLVGPAGDASAMTDATGRAVPWAGTRCQAGQGWHWDGVDFELLHPLDEDYASAKKTNPLSCVLRISNGQQSALLTGDIEQAQEASLVQRQAGDNRHLTGALAGPQAPLTRRTASNHLHSDVLVVPHHGSLTSSSALFLQAVQPRLALVQAGYRNRFGHPAGPVLVRYADQQIKVLDTPHCGAVTWRSWRPDAPQCQRQTDLRYWRHRLP